MVTPTPTPEQIHDERLVIDVIDEIAAKHPERVWGSFPVSSSDLSAGFQDVTYRSLSHAIDTAAFWLDSVLGQEDGDVFAFYGDRDFRQAILAAAAAKTGRQFQFINAWSSESAKLGLLSYTQCKVWIHTDAGRALASSLTKARSGLRAIECPSQAELLDSAPEHPYRSRITWEEARDKTWIILHTTGSTGNPKPVRWTHNAFRSTERFKRFKDFGESKIAMFQNQRFFQPLACAHSMGLVISLDIVPSMNAPMVIGPRDRMPIVSDIREIFKHGRVNGMYSTPIFVKQLTEHDDLLAHLRSFAFVYYGGAKADRHWGDLLYQHTSVGPIFGSTETGHVHLRRLDGPDWHWYDFYDWEGVAFEEVKQGLFEMVFNRVPGQWQHAFWSHPDRDQYRTRDLWVRHPTRPTLWAYHGRADDFVMLTCGDGVDAAFLQEKLEACPAVQMAMVGGQGKDRPWLLLELKQSITREENQGWVVDLFRVLDEINETLPNITKISSKRIIIANPDKPLARTAKLALDRNKTVELYKGKIAALDMATV